MNHLTGCPKEADDRNDNCARLRSFAMLKTYKIKGYSEFTIEELNPFYLKVHKDGKLVARVDIIKSYSRGTRYRPEVNGLVVSDNASLGNALASVRANLRFIEDADL